jgi:hypothetical protein
LDFGRASGDFALDSSRTPPYSASSITPCSCARLHGKKLDRDGSTTC